MAIMASSHCVCVSDHASIAWPVIQFWGSWLGTVKRDRREADRKLTVISEFGCGDWSVPDCIVSHNQISASNRRRDLKQSHSMRTNRRPIAIIRRPCSDSLLTASQMDQVFGSDSQSLADFQ